MKNNKNLSIKEQLKKKQNEDIDSFLTKKQILNKDIENSIDDAIFYKDIYHRYIGCNKKFADFFDMNEKEIVGKTDFDLFDEATALKYYSRNEELLNRNKKKVTHKQWIEYKEKRIYTIISKTPIIDKEGCVIGIVGIIRNITNEYMLQKEIEHKNIMLIQQNKLISMGEMIANIAHQWRQPLNTLGLIIQKLDIFYKEGVLTPNKIDSNISEAMLLIREMSETINDFQNFFNPKKIVEDFDIYEAIIKSHAITKTLLISNNINFQINSDKSYFIHGYKNEFFQVILNILNNAIDALITDKIPTPTINIIIREKEGKIFITISDNANGINQNDIEKIFTPYFTTKENGTGLGLYMSKIIIEEHMKGELHVDSDLFGTTFTIILKEGISPKI